MSDILCTVAPTNKNGVLMDVVATAITMDEACMAMTEQNIQSPGSRGFHRYRTVVVIRGDREATFMEDLGPVELWTGCQQFRLPGGTVNRGTGRFEIVHTVGELYDIANSLRGEPIPEEIVPRDLWQEAIGQAEERQRQARALSSFGVGTQIQRS